MRFATSVRHHASLARATSDVARLVGHVVHLAAEGVEGRDGAALLRAAGRGSCSRSSSRWRPPSAGSIRRESWGGHPDRRWPPEERFPEDARPVPGLQAPGGGGTRRPRTASILSRMRSPPAEMARISRPDAPGQARAQRRARTHHGARALALEAHQVPPRRRRRGPRRSGASSTPKRAQVLLRQVDAALAPVDGDVLPVVDELQARADGVGVAQVAPGRPCGRG